MGPHQYRHLKFTEKVNVPIPVLVYFTFVVYISNPACIKGKHVHSGVFFYTYNILKKIL